MFSLLAPRYLAPDAVISHIDRLDVEFLRMNGIRGAVVDYDGVIASYNSLELPPQKTLSKLAELKNAGINVVLLSNRRGRFQDSMTQFLDYPIIHSQRMKPHREPYEHALFSLGTKAGETVLIEDRLLTGIAGGKRVGMYTLWVAQPRGTFPLKIRVLCAVEHFILSLYVLLGFARVNNL